MDIVRSAGHHFLIRSMLSKAPHMSALAQLMGSEKYSDLKLVCEGHVFRVHKATVCSQSPVLTAACDGAFQVYLIGVYLMGMHLMSMYLMGMHLKGVANER